MSAHDHRTASAPTSTYRLQLGPGFTLQDAAGLLDQLDRLGVGALYLSPVLTAAPGSQHGYDVADPTRVAPVLGGDEAREELAEQAHARGLHVVTDIVPNHVSVARPDANPWWWDLLRLGPDSPYARCFDVDLSVPLLVPVLGEDADEALTIADGCLAYHEKRYPLAPGTFEPGDDIETVHRRQHYRLVSWRRGDSELTYRRFFDVDDLAAVRVEDPAVFEASHAEILRWAERGQLDGLRVDHVDGLSDPGAYLRRLTARFPGWLVVEKILAPGEDLPQSWPVAGTTGYDALREHTGVLVDPAGESDLTALATGEGVPVDVEATDHTARLHAATTLLRAETRRIAALVPPHSEEAVAELLAAFAVYRTYLPEGLDEWLRAVDLAGERRPDLAPALAALDQHVRSDPEGEAARRIQQTSGMIVAMGTENTAFYRATRFIALNEVGGDPARFSVAPEEFHTAAARREARHPHTMTTLSTHDTKRSEDVRARLAVLSETAADFTDAVRRWSAAHPLPEPSLDLLGWQTLVGAWPIGEERLTEHLLKAAREARLGTSWTEPDHAFEQAVRDWVPAVLTGLREEVEAFVERVRGPGWSNSLTQKALQLLGPGVPDLYQGTELWDLSLVDPDNRRPVDHRTRAELLDRLEAGWRPPVDTTGAAKLHLVRTCLHTRRELDPRGYTPLHAEGPAARHALAFARSSPEAHTPDLAVVGTRLPLTLERTGGWDETVLPLPPGPWTDRLTGEPVPPTRADGATAPRLADLLGRYPVAVLVRG
ncbi:malto-oligosyltrehalose synthase [Nocardiopsis sp. HNM0947]|uniref:Malto-oligosyltrehalose synthase n=1 Tax=Nocardiopsis coralli TaxID=2772213 RepID=A0ABR9P0V2_9ACTN|nr:malto-oligosyltrehalose synthase [Nocardiopsis coralli]MBE2997488.1 malto-oligosyltrehalose synthase [Nocardiopsis coralli]